MGAGGPGQHWAPHYGGADACYLIDHHCFYDLRWRNRLTIINNWACGSHTRFIPLLPFCAACFSHGTLPLVKIRFFLLQNRQGKTRLSKWYVAIEEAEKRRIENEVHRLVTSRDSKFTNFVEVRVDWVVGSRLQLTPRY